MQVTLTNVFFRNLAALSDPTKKIAINEGGTSSSKTYSILMLLIDICKHRTKPLLVSVVSESFPHLSLGAIRDFKLIMGADFDSAKWNATNHVYSFGEAQIEFFSADNPSKAHGPRRDILYCNEVNNIPKPIVDALSIRTRRFEIYDFNPVEEFWAHEIKNRPDVAWIHSTYLDAKHVLPPEIVAKIEAKRLTDPYWWSIYGLGKVGVREGLVHSHFMLVDDFPKTEDVFYGLDFGYTNDPSVLTKNTIHNGILYSDELFYSTGLTNKNIIDTFASLGVKKHYDEIYADSNEPKTIAEIFDAGYNIIGVTKGEDSVRNGIQAVNSFPQAWTKRSINSIKEQRGYRYIQDSNGKFTNKPLKTSDHSMDSRRYALMGYNAIRGREAEGARIKY